MKVWLFDGVTQRFISYKSVGRGIDMHILKTGGNMIEPFCSDLWNVLPQPSAPKAKKERV
jgi:hypothetical protein